MSVTEIHLHTATPALHKISISSLSMHQNSGKNPDKQDTGPGFKIKASVVILKQHYVAMR